MSHRSFAATQVCPWEQYQERRSVSESTKRWTTLKTERLQTLASLSKYNGDKRDREQHIGLK